MGEPLQFIGDLSLLDATVLRSYGFSSRVLEFGSGGSTQIFAQSADEVVSVETDPVWIARTQNNLNLLKYHNPVKFVPYDLFKYEGSFDVVFVDGVPSKRLDFAIRAWNCLKPGGCMIFHDTRRFEYFKEAAWIMQLHFLEIKDISVNHADSNMTVINKRNATLEYVNWNETENKPKWAYGIGDLPEGEGLWKQD